MKANELMLGDWVEPHQCRTPTLYCKVEGIYPDDTVQLDKAERLFAFDELHPIPLTGKILEKNGFGYDEVHDVYQLHTMDYIIVEVGIYHPDFINIGYRQYTPDGIDEGNISSISKVDGNDLHVHELQHTLRLCGIEKTIEL